MARGWVPPFEAQWKGPSKNWIKFRLRVVLYLNCGVFFQTSLHHVESSEELAHLQQYLPGLREITLVRLLKQVAQVYQSITLDKLLKLAPFADPFGFERVIVDCVRHNDMQVAAIFYPVCSKIKYIVMKPKTIWMLGSDWPSHTDRSVWYRSCWGTKSRADWRSSSSRHAIRTSKFKNLLNTMVQSLIFTCFLGPNSTHVHAGSFGQKYQDYPPWQTQDGKQCSQIENCWSIPWVQSQGSSAYFIKVAFSDWISMMEVSICFLLLKAQNDWGKKRILGEIIYSSRGWGAKASRAATSWATKTGLLKMVSKVYAKRHILN